MEEEEEDETGTCMFVGSDKATSTGTIMDRVDARFLFICATKDEANSLFREKRFSAAFEHYSRSLAELRLFCREYHSALLEEEEKQEEEEKEEEEEQQWGKDFSPRKPEPMEVKAIDLTTEGFEREDASDGEKVEECEVADLSPVYPSFSKERGITGCKRRRLDITETQSTPQGNTGMLMEEKDDNAPDSSFFPVMSTLFPFPPPPPLLPLATLLPLRLHSPNTTSEKKHRSFDVLTDDEKRIKRLEIILRLNIAACCLRLSIPIVGYKEIRHVLAVEGLPECEPLLFAKTLLRYEWAFFKCCRCWH